MALNCLDCKAKACKAKGADCFDLHGISREIYARNDVNRLVKNASRLVDNGRAGELSRFEEVIEFCQLQKYKNVGIAYCFGLEELAGEIRKKMVKAGINILPARCTMGGVKERHIDENKDGDAISCNPAGQAHFLNSRADFVIELGLCLGHDVVFHEELTVPFTVLLVKDRVNNHAPLQGIHKTQIDCTIPPADFLKNLDNSMAMKSSDWLLEGMNDKNRDIIILDLRSEEAFKKGHIEGSVQVNIQELPEQAFWLISDTKKEVVVTCNGSIQSAMAVMYLKTAGYKRVFNLSGGISSWERQEKPLVQT